MAASCYHAAVPDETRRSFLDAVLWTSLAATAGACLAPVPFYLLPPADARTRSRAVARKRDALPVGSHCTLMVGSTGAIVVNDGTIRAFDIRCTHTQAPVTWDGKAMRFVCRMHGAVFASTGEPLSGPAKAPLKPLSVEVTSGGDVVVSD